ncbi:hypothetical protein QN277_007162 [Acacia crassicarpa]|uniref:AP2/ERF domain-containing protein n=1 Tax=Acacia crassicarpa TaxID=499986 RepID=A0AAE1IWQ6_9FABA|nr:hypothetical protein QN277_007162 [Acacia crassicarpa]
MGKHNSNSNKNRNPKPPNNSTSVTATTTTKKRTRRSVPRDTPLQRSSEYRGVTRHRWTGRYEAHLWDKNCWNESQNKKGRQGAYDDEDAAAHAYDLAALKYWGQETILNFPLSTYLNEMKEMEGQSREEYIGSLRRKSSGFSRGVSKYRGVARHHHNGRWEARIGRVFGNKYLYLGTYATQEEAATAYDMAAIEYRGLNAVTNFDLSRYIKWLKPKINNGIDMINSTSNSIKSSMLCDSDNNNNPNYSDTNFTAPSPNPNIYQEHGFNSFITTHQQESASFSSGDETTATASYAQSRQANATSALGLLLQSSKFKEMIEMTSAADLSVATVTAPVKPEESRLPACRFPADIQTYFECEEDSNNDGYGEGDHNTVFSELNNYSFVSPMFDYHDDDFET